MKTTLDLADNQFLKIIFVSPKENLIFEVYEVPAQKWRRPFRWASRFGVAGLVNRHQKKHKIEYVAAEVDKAIRNFRYAKAEEGAYKKDFAT